MTIRVDSCLTRVGFSLGFGDQWPSAVSGLDLVNEVGEWLIGSHPWKFLDGREGYLDLRGLKTTTAATTTTDAAPGLTLTDTSSPFADYAFLDGDRITITGGTGVTVGTYDIASRTNDDTIVLKTSPGASATAIAATLTIYTIELPVDFGELRGGDPIHAKDNLVSSMVMVPMQDIIQRRSSPTQATASWVYHGAISHNSLMQPILEIYPGSTSNSNEHFRVLYSAKWDPVVNDTDQVMVPAYMEGLFLMCCTEYGRGLFEEDNMPLADRLTRIESSTIYNQCVRQDGRIQRTYGLLRGGAVSPSSRRDSVGILRSEVSSPG